MLQKINQFGSNYLIVQNHAPLTCSLSGLWNWKCKHLLAQQGYSKYENKATAFFSFLPIKEHEHHKLFSVEAATLFFLLKIFKLHMPETAWNSGKNELHALAQKVKEWSHEQQLCNPPLQPTVLKKKKKKSEPQKKATLPLPFPQTIGQGRGEVTSFPIPSNTFPSHQLRQVLAENTFLAADQITHWSCTVGT